MGSPGARRSRAKKSGKKLLLAYCDRDGNVYDLPGYEPAFRTGRRFVRVPREDLIALPEGSVLFSLPERRPVFYDAGRDGFFPVDPGEGDLWAASAFISSGYLRTHLPAFAPAPGAPALPLWAYAGVVISGGEFLVPAMRIDDDPRSDPAIHKNEKALRRAIEKTARTYPSNRLVGQLAGCAMEYRCLCARNFFLARHEAPVPTTPACNAACAGCLSHQEGTGFPGSQPRIGFDPSPTEIAEVMVHHLAGVDGGVASFGQGCEGEPLLRGKDLAEAIRLVREKTDRGTIHLNTNGSLPAVAERLIEAGLDSIRVSLNSPSDNYYTRYYRPSGYAFRDVMKTVEISLRAGIFVSINLFILPGFSDMETEADALFGFLREYPVNMIQARNLNIDPDYYLDSIDFVESEPLGVKNLIGMIREKFPRVIIGYYNPPKEKWGR